jgi:protein-tyrosine kinase
MRDNFPFRQWFVQKGPRSDQRYADFLKTGEGDDIFQEQFRSLRSNIEYRSDLLGWKVLGITSAIAGEGKTFACAKMAATLAFTKRKKVLVVDADIRKGDLSKGMLKSVSPGLSDFLLGSAGWEEIRRTSGIPNLDAIPAGGKTADAKDLLAGERFHPLIERARKEYDIILLDTPPVLPVADAMSMRDHLDGFVFLYRTGFTPVQLFLQAAEEIGEKKILGVVLNGVERKSDKYYSQYYGHYYVKQADRPNTSEAAE